MIKCLGKVEDCYFTVCRLIWGMPIDRVRKLLLYIFKIACKVLRRGGSTQEKTDMAANSMHRFDGVRKLSYTTESSASR